MIRRIEKQTKDGPKVCYRITAEASCSKMAHGQLRIQKTFWSITEREASRRYEAMKREVLLAAEAKERQGELWRYVVDEYEMNLRKNALIQNTTKDDKIAALRKYSAVWDRRTIDSINIFEVETIFDNLIAEGKSYSRIKAIRSAIRSVFDFAIRAQISGSLKSNPVELAKINMRREERTPEILNSKEIRILLEEAKRLGHPWYPIWQMAIMTGMRSGELYALTWNEVDFVEKVIHVNHSYNNRLRKIGPTKGKRSRKIPI